MAAPAYQSIGTASETAPAWGTHASGSFGILACEHPTGTIPTPTGWTVLARVSSGVHACILSLFYRFATSGAEGAPDITGSGADHVFGNIIAYTGVNTANPIHGLAVGDNASSVNNCSPGLTTQLDDCTVVNVFAWSPDTAGPESSGETNSTLTGVAERYDGGTITGNGGGLVIIEGTMASKGSFAQTEITLTTSSASPVVTVALQSSTQTFAANGIIINQGPRMAIPVKQSTAQTVGVWMADSADGKTGKTGLTLAVTLKKSGESSFSSIAPTVTEIGSGHYDVALTTTHMNTVGAASLRATSAGADPADCPNIVDVIAYDKTSATRGTAGTALPDAVAAAANGVITFGTGSGQLDVAGGRADADTIYWNGSAVAAPTTAGVPEVDVTHWIGTAAATPSVAGVPEVDVTHWIGTAAATPTTAGVPEVDVTHWIGTAAATPTVAGVPEIDVTHWNGTAVAAPTTAGVPRVDVKAMEANVMTASALATDAVTEIVAAIFAYAHDTSRTVLGLFRRLEAYVAGTATGLNGSNPKYFRQDGSTAAIDATQNTATGARSAVTVTGSEP